MNSFNEFFRTLLKDADISTKKDLTIDEIKMIVASINKYFFTTYDGIGKTTALDEEFEYFSEFHKFWEKHHGQILNPKIDDFQCEKAADVLHDLYVRYDKQKLFYELYNTQNLNEKEICKIRYFSANQDFRGSRDFGELAKKYGDDPTIFDKDNILNNPEDFLKNIGITGLSQNDKRVKYAQTAAKILIDKNLEPYDLYTHFDKDILKIRNFLLTNRGTGFGNKKVDMFLRDMVVLGVWKEPQNFDKLDVASDINTVKVALRAKIFKTDIVLLSSFLDVFCYQYGLIDQTNAKAWRRVWEIWKKNHPKECIESPCLIDYLVYRIIGKEFCKESLCLFKCEQESHQFKWHSSRNKTCQLCYRTKIKNNAILLSKKLPCTDNEGHIVIEKNEFVAGDNAALPGIKECPFVNVCNPKNKEFKKLNPPKSISILGQTGWESAKTTSDEGGGGLMA